MQRQTQCSTWTKPFCQGREGGNDHPQSATPLSQPTAENIQLPRQVVNNGLMMKL